MAIVLLLSERSWQRPQYLQLVDISMHVKAKVLISGDALEVDDDAWVNGERPTWPLKTAFPTRNSDALSLINNTTS
jgi:hypothetical protein